jgi:asparagine synthase (glutamine-hydrolysing)
MCGIIGIINFNKEAVDPAALKKAASYMNTRGPDSDGFWFHENLALGHKRLSIIDLSDLGHQPMISGDGQVVIVFNGEIYNYPQLKEDLRRQGIEFRSNSDTEVLLAGYQAWGIETLLDRIDGMFAFGLYDQGRRLFIGARDRFGKKPFYYSGSPSAFVFASDIRAVTAFGKNHTLDPESLDFFFQEMAMPQPHTIWKEVKQLEPGTYLSINLSSPAIAFRKYARLSFEKKDYTLSEALEMTETMLTRAILKRTIADVPVACFLSGGIDSGLIVSMLAQHSTQPVNTFTVGFSNSDSDETALAEQLARRYGTNHQSIVINNKISDYLPGLLDEMGEPFADSSLIPSFLVSREMAKHYKVALSGDGGDELFGYNNYNYAVHLEQLRKDKPGVVKRKILVSKLASRFGIGQNLGIYAHDLKELKPGKLLRRNMVFSQDAVGQLMQNPLPAFTNDYMERCMAAFGASGLADQVVSGSLISRLLNDYLVKVDRASMINSLEVRSPFLDTDLARLAFQIPFKWHYKNRITKYILKKLAEKYIDPGILSRKKTGFSLPIAQLLRTDLKPFMMDMLATRSLNSHGLFNTTYVDGLVRQHVSGEVDHAHRLWALITFQYWYQKYGKS